MLSFVRFNAAFAGIINGKYVVNCMMGPAATATFRESAPVRQDAVQAGISKLKAKKVVDALGLEPRTR
jgi:hypothetical protein